MNAAGEKLIIRVNAGKHMPEFMRDFHDQKDLFKTIDAWAKQGADYYVDWVRAQIYTCDIFLRYMALRGYTLQRDRSLKGVARGNVFADIQERKSKEIDLIKEMLSRGTK